jgi:hypothetical protein
VLRNGTAVGVKILPKHMLDDSLHMLAELEKLSKLGASQEMHFFTRYLEVVRFSHFKRSRSGEFALLIVGVAGRSG